MRTFVCGAARDGWCGQCYENIRGRANHRGHFGYRQPRSKGRCYMALSKPKTADSSRSGMPESSWAASCMAAHLDLMAFLSSTSLPDGSARRVGTLQISTGAGRWQVKLRDPDNCVYCFVTGATLQEALEAADRTCSTGEADWRRDEPFQGRKGGK